MIKSIQHILSQSIKNLKLFIYQIFAFINLLKMNKSISKRRKITRAPISESNKI